MFTQMTSGEVMKFGASMTAVMLTSHAYAALAQS